jgi:P-type E1-E2 ATPase
MLVMRLNTHSNLRPEAVDVIRKIMIEGQEVHILSGDSKESVLNLGELLNIPRELLHAEHSSFMKMEWIKKVQELGKDGVMMIGDGLNDIPCLQEAAIGVSINAKSELNINAADVVVLDDNLYKILALIRMLKKGNLFININLFWAFSYNIVIMPIVAGVFYKWDFWVSPIWSSIAMSMSSIIVVSISHLLSFFKFDESLRP